MHELPFRRVTRENWLKPDPVNFAFVGTKEQFLDAILAPQLDPVVPEAVLGLFEIARGTMAHGYLFYPFYTIAWEQLFRVGEAAITHRCTAASTPTSIDTFDERIGWLVVKGALTSEGGEWWHWLRKGRNLVSHQSRQSLAPPGWAIEHLESVAARINALFVKPLATRDAAVGEEYAAGEYVRVQPSHRHAKRHGRVGKVTSVVGNNCLVQECRPDSQEPFGYWVNWADLQKATENDCTVQIVLDELSR